MGIKRQDYEKEFSINCSYYAMRIWVWAIVSGLLLPAFSGDTPQRTRCLRRDTDLQRQLDRDRLQVPLQRVIRYCCTLGILAEYSDLIAHLRWSRLLSQMERHLSAKGSHPLERPRELIRSQVVTIVVKILSLLSS